MKTCALPIRKTPAEKQADLNRFIAAAAARGEKVPDGVRLIKFREMTPEVERIAQSLVPAARAALARAAKARNGRAAA